MENKKNYMVSDAYIFAFKEGLAHIRPLFFIALMTIGSIAAVGLFGAAYFYSMLQSIPDLMQQWQQTQVPIGTIGSPLMARIGAFLGVILTQLPWGMLLFSILLFLFLIIGFSMAIYGTLALAIYDGKASQRVLFPSIANILKLGVVFCMQLFVGIIGFLLLVVPGVLWLIKTAFVPFAVLDGAGIFQAYGKSFALTRGNGWIVFGWFIVFMSIGVLFQGVGMILAPLAFIASAYLYRTFEKTA